MTGLTDRPLVCLSAQEAQNIQTELEYSRRLEAMINEATEVAARSKTKQELGNSWAHLRSLIKCRTAQQILRMERAKGLK